MTGILGPHRLAAREVCPWAAANSLIRTGMTFRMAGLNVSSRYEFGSRSPSVITDSSVAPAEEDHPVSSRSRPAISTWLRRFGGSQLPVMPEVGRCIHT